MKLRTAVTFAVVVTLSAMASATTTTWYLQNAVFQDGGIATGSFVFDSSTQTVTSYNITVSGGDTGLFPEFTYQDGTPHNLGVDYYKEVGIIWFHTDLGHDPSYRTLRLPVVPLPDDGGDVTFDLKNRFQAECYDCIPARVFISGSVTSHPQTFSVIHNFQGPDGAQPHVGVTVRGGVVYGTASAGGKSCGTDTSCGTAYQVKHVGSNWITSPIFLFPTSGSGLGYLPVDRVVFGPDAHLYGETYLGLNGLGTVYRLTPPLSICRTANCFWTANELYTFHGSTGANPSGGDLSWDQQGNFYGTTRNGGNGLGIVFQMSGSGNNWTKTTIHAFSGGTDGANPFDGVVVDSNGNLFGTSLGGHGKVYKLTYDPQTGWTKTQVHEFGSDWPSTTGVILDGAGNLYGATASSIFELSPSGDTWIFNVLYQFPVGWSGPNANLTLDAKGELYGTTYSGGAYGKGSIFELSNADNGWVYKSLHDFTGEADGAFPISQVTIDTDGTLYGTASHGGSNDQGVVWMIKR